MPDDQQPHQAEKTDGSAAPAEPIGGSGAGAAAAAAAAPGEDDAEGAAHEADQPAEPLRAADRGRQHGCFKGTMMPLNSETRRRSFWKQYPSYRVQPLLYKRYNQLVEAEDSARRARSTPMPWAG